MGQTKSIIVDPNIVRLFGISLVFLPAKKLYMVAHVKLSLMWH